MEEMEGDEAAVRMFCTREEYIYIHIYIHLYHIYDSITHFFVSSSVDEHSLFLAIVKRYAKKTYVQILLYIFISFPLDI